MAKVIGIDLGTSNSAAAVMQGDRPAIIPSAEGTIVGGGKAFPSYVAFTKNGELLVAESAFADPIGRLVRLDTFGTVLWNFGAGSFNIINDCKLVNNSNLMLSLW